VPITRAVAASVFGLALATGALAQTAQTAQTAQKPPTTSAAGYEGVKQEHPEWFKSKRPYFPCPTSVEVNGRNVCLGCPTTCQQHF
jgi:hypothetical protein